MHFWKEHSGKIVISHQTRAEQLAIDKLYELLKVSPVEDIVYILDGYDAHEAARQSPGWKFPNKKEEEAHEIPD